MRGYTDTEVLAYCNKAFGEDNPYPPLYHLIEAALTERQMFVAAKMSTDEVDERITELRRLGGNV